MVSPATGPTAGAQVSKRVPRLDGIRGLCALAVIVAHVAFTTIVLPSSAGDPPQGIWSILAAGQLSIGPFFILSGLLLYRPFAKHAILGTPRPKLGQYAVRRMARMVPAFYLLATFSIVILNYSTIKGLWDVLRPYFLLHVYDYRWYAGLDVAWTVPTEAQFYILLPIMAFIMHRLARGVDDPVKKARRMYIPIVVLGASQFAWTAYVNARYDFWPHQFFYPFGIAALLAAGMALAIVSVVSEARPESTPRWYRLAATRPNWFWIGALVVYLINCAQPFGVPGTADWQSPAAALVRSVLLLLSAVLLTLPLYVPGGSSKFMEFVLSNPPMRFLGRISYGLYLWHFAVMYLVFRDGSIFGSVTPVQALIGKYGFWELVLPTVFGTILAASISWYIVERPIIMFAERRVKARNARLAAAPVAADPGPAPQVGPADRDDRGDQKAA